MSEQMGPETNWDRFYAKRRRLAEMSETPSGNTEQEAEGVRPLSKEQEASIRKAVDLNLPGLVWTPNTLGPLFASLDAARIELGRKEADAAALREALTNIENRYYAVLHPAEQMRNLAHEALHPTTAGAASLERVRELEGEVERLQVWRNAVVEYIDAADPEKGGPYVKALVYERLWGLVAEYRKGHQGTGEEVSE